MANGSYDRLVQFIAPANIMVLTLRITLLASLSARKSTERRSALGWL